MVAPTTPQWNTAVSLGRQLRDLAVTLDRQAEVDAFAERMRETHTRATASTLISDMLVRLRVWQGEDAAAVQAAAPRPTRRVTPPAEGVYWFEGDYYRVGKTDRGFTYVRRYDVQKHSWVKAFRMWDVLTEETRLTAEQASQFGKLWGHCVFCSRVLTDERSVDVGYGPVCADNNNLPWGARPELPQPLEVEA